MKALMKCLLCLCMILAFCSCSNSTETDNDGPTVQEDDSQYGVIETTELSDTYENGAYRETLQKYDDFAIRFMKHTVTEDDNEIISPLSLYYAMAILANGANGQSRSELETYLGMTVNDLNAFLSAMDQDNSGYTTYYKKANALWFNTSKGLKLNEEFRNTVATYYGDSIFEEDFKDGNKLVADANRWSAKQTDGAIDHILEDDEINQDSLFLILNALVSGEKWLFPFDSKDTYPELFYCHDGTVKTTDMMHQSIDGYWHDSKSEGFLKSLENGTYFLAILPNEGIDIYDYLYAMNKDTFRDYRSSVVYSENMREGGTYGCIEDVHISNISFPKFSYEKEYDLNTSLKKAGLKNIFHPATADFSLMADGDQKLIDQLYVDRIKQKCSIEVNEKEVIAAAVTSVELGLGAGSCDIGKTYYHDIVFDRPFIYVLLCGDSPMFIGVVTDLGEEATGGFVIENIVGSVNIRQKPTTSSEILGETHKGNRFYAYETTEAEGYTWYRIGEDRWVADNGKWFKVVE